MDAELKNSILKTGTTILGIVCKDGIVMAGDRRGTVGNLIYSRDYSKVRVLNDYLVFSGCGSAAETQKVSKLLTAELKLKELKSLALFVFVFGHDLLFNNVFYSVLSYCNDINSIS